MILASRLAPLLACVLLLSSCARNAKQQAVVAATPVPAVTPTPAAMPSPSPAPTPVPTAKPAPAPTAAPTPLSLPRAGTVVEVVDTPIPKPTLAPAGEIRPHVISLAPATPVQTKVRVTPQDGRYAGRLAAPDDPPRIFSVEISDDTPGSGERVSGKVVTTTNVAAVRASLEGITIGFRREDAGVFTVSYTVPRIPFFLKRGYTLEITAETTGGRTATAQLPIRVH